MSDTSRDHDRDGMTVHEAAAMLGISESAVRKRVERGKLDHEHDVDGRLIVYPDTSATGPGQSRRQSRDAATERYVTSLEDQVTYLRGQLDAEREANRENRRIIAGLIERVPELEPASSSTSSGEPQESPETSAEEPTGAEGRTTTQEPPESKPWWRRILGGG